MEIVAWCIMTNHVHLVFRSINGIHPANLLGDFKRFTSKAMIKAIQENPEECNRNLWLDVCRKEAIKSHNVSDYQFWRHDNKPIELWSNAVIHEKITYVHRNPVAAGLVYKPEAYQYSSAIDYADGKGLLKGIRIFQFLD